MEGYPETPSRLLSGTPENWVRLGLGSAPSPFAPALVPMQVLVERRIKPRASDEGQIPSQYLSPPTVCIPQIRITYIYSLLKVKEIWFCHQVKVIIDETFDCVLVLYST